MNRKSVVATLHSVCSEKFIQAKLPDGSTLKYVHVFDRPYDSHQMGITEDGYWCVAHEGRIWPLKTTNNAYIFFLLLYTPIKDIIEHIKTGLKDLKLPIKIAFTFPFDELILGAFQTGWKTLALKWIDQGYPLNDEMRLFLCDNDKQSKMWQIFHQERLCEIFGI